MATTTNLGIGKLDAATKQPEVPLNTAFDYYDAVLAGRLQKSVAGSANVTLTSDEARNRRIELTGTLTANITLFIPVPGGSPSGNTSRNFTIFNNTTGAFTITIKTTATGSTGISVPQGFTQLLEHDGTNVYPVAAVMGTSATFVPEARAFHNAAQSIPSGVATPLALNSETLDTNSIHDLVTNNSRLTCNTAGLYFIWGNFELAVSSGGLVRIISIRLNGTTFIDLFHIFSPNSTYAPTLSISTAYSLNVGDYVELCATQDTGGALNVNQTSYSPIFGMVKIG